MLVSAAIGKASILIQDISAVRWPEAELVGWLNDGQRETVQHRHDASVLNSSITLASNVTRQALPAGSIALLNISRNMGVDGLTPGAPIKKIERTWLDALIPGWGSEVGSTVIKNYISNPLDPKHFDVYPRPHATTVVQVDALICVQPADCALPSVTPTAVLTLADEYANALINYIVFRALSKDTEAGDQQRAGGYFGLFMAGLGIKSKSDAAASASTTNTGTPA
jgi:hypothetical protein